MEPFRIKVILIELDVIKTDFVQDLIVLHNRYRIDKISKYNDQVNLDNDNMLFSVYYNIIWKFLSFYYKAMSKASQSRIVANKIFQAIEKVMNGMNINFILRVIVRNDSKKYFRLKKELQDNVS